ncbi:MAG TPA: hypothetical protein PLU37_00415 [Chitinophagaceae bacterium]|nr:hypothetical protein [Chitinophagaceae bacterium]
MPISLHPKLHSSLRIISLILILTAFPQIFNAQTLTGLWIGSTSNDSNTVRQNQSFEIALTEYKGKVYGYSRSEFIVNDTLYYIVKRVKGKIDGDICEVTDDEIISYNFRGKLDKGVKVTSTFRRNKEDSTWHLDGTWKTNTVKKKYYSITGKVKLAEEKDLTASKIFPHLEELNIADEVAFYKERKVNEQEPALKLVRPEIDPLVVNNTALERDTKILVIDKPQLNRAETDKESTESIVASAEIDKEVMQKAGLGAGAVETKKISTENTEIKAAAIKPMTVKTVDPAVAARETQKAASDDAVSKSSAKTEKPVIKANPVVNNTRPIATNNSEQPKINTSAVTKDVAQKTTEPLTVAKPVIDVAALEKAKEKAIQQSAVVEGRKSEFAQEVQFSGDSLQIALYDNGVVDGDTVSIYMNGEVIMSKQGLKASAIKKTIYLTPGKDDAFTLVLYAENLGQYPPNTGLLVVKDGDKVYNLRFSSDFSKSTGIVFRRKNR